MALTGIQIFKLLPKTNCGECGVPTCLAFAMNLAAGKAELAKCPYVSEEAKAQLAAESAPPIRTVEIPGGDGNAAKVGGETVLYRHEKTFFNKTGIAVRIADDEAGESIEGKIERFRGLRYVRVGLTLRAELVSVASRTGDAGRFASLVEKVVAGTDAGLILESDKPEVLEAGLKAAKGRKALLCAATEANADAVAKLAKEAGSPVVARAEGLAALSALATKLAGAGLKDIVLDPGSRAARQALQDEVAIRRLAVQKRERSVGFPTIAFPCDMAPGDLMRETVLAGVLVPKYAGIVVLSDLRGENLFPLLLERLNIFTDPQRPMKTEQGIYEFNHPGPASPVLVTSNFSLTYFIVSGEIENSRVPSWLLIVDTDGLSVLTAWAAGKFVGDTVGPFVKKSGIGEKLEKRSLILPGMASVILGDVEEELGKDWEVLVGPREASHLPAYLRQKFAA